VGQWMYGLPHGARGLRSAMWHLFYAKRYRELVALLSDLPFIEAMSEIGDIYEVVDVTRAVLKSLNTVASKKTAQVGNAISFVTKSSVSGKGFKPSPADSPARRTTRGDDGDIFALDNAVVVESPPPIGSTVDAVEELRRLRKLVDVLEQMDILLTSWAHRLDLHPLLTYQLIANGPDTFPVTLLAKNAWKRGLEVRPYLRYINKPQVCACLSASGC
jgi:hypothetical protein